ncbi:MAG: HAMP domain-containing histidine kinase [Acidobacteria bacterium]|nr:HAMP domain-containing histidine kinase [Acidobacteriota bacterium]
MRRTLYGKLAVFLLVLFALIGSSYVLLTVFTTKRHIQEVNQQLNRGLAAHLVSENILMEDGRINEVALEDVFHMLMVINPNIELYLLGPEGDILAFSAPPGTVERERVSLEPLRRFLSGSSVLPILGDDPRGRTRRKIFSVAPIAAAGEDSTVGGYLYIVLASEEYDSAVAMLGQSYILRLSLGIAAGGLLFALLGGLVGFRVLTRRLRALSVSMDDFRRQRLRGGHGAEGRGTGGAGDEIDELARSFEEMARRIDEQMQELEEKDTLRRELVANVSHDLRTPLATLHGYLETLSLKEATLPPAERAEYLAAAIRHSERLGRLIDELFELAKMDAGETRPQAERFSMAELVQDVVQEFQLRAAERSVRLEADFGVDFPFVEADIGMMERVLENLVENALRHTPAQGRVTVRLISDGQRLHVEVEDTGCGIPAEVLPRIFERFYKVRADGSTTPGSGLGLAISKRILELHGCPIEARSTPGQGTIFAFGLPVVAMSNAP